MKYQIFTSALAVAGALFLAGCAGGGGYSPDGWGMVGMWSGESNVVSAKYGYGKGQRTIVIKDQQGTEFRGENTWSTKQSDGQMVRVTEKVIGTIDPATGCVFLSEVDDTGRWVGRMVDNDTIEMVYMESGPDAATFRTVLKRQGTASR